MGPRQHPDGAGLIRIAGQGPVVVAVGAHQVGQELGVAGIGLGA